jgi:predicted nucleotidyltransferase
MLAKQHSVGVAKIKQLLAQGIKHELAQATDHAAAREMALEKLQHELDHYDLLEEAANMTTAALRNRLNKLMAEDQTYADATQRAPWQEGVWRFITANKAQIFSDLGDSGNGGYPSAPFAAWLLVQHMDPHPERQAAFYKLLKSAIPNHPKLEWLRDRAAVNQWIMQHYQEPQFHRDGKPLANPTSDVRDHRLFKDAGILAASRQEALDNAEASGNKLLVAAVKATGAKTQPSYTQQTKESMEEAAIDTTEYGGWITPDKQIEYVDTHDHAAHVARHHNLDYNEAFLDGFLRFANHSRTNTFSVEGMLPVLRKTYRMWAPTALAADRVYVDIYKWQDHMVDQGLTPHMMFRPKDGDKPQIINSFGPQSAQLSEGSKRKAKTLIDGMIKSLIKQGRTRDEAISDLKKQVDSRFYEAIDLLANGDILEENLRDWFKQKWVRFGPDGQIKGACARGSDSEGKPKCLPQAKAHALGKKKRATAARRKRREDPNANRKGRAKNVRTKESIAENSALRSATMRVQRMLNDRFGANLDIDGKLGPLTLASINQFMPAAGFGPADDPTRTTAVQGGELKAESCPHCGGVMYEASQMMEKKDACYYKVKSRYKVWPSAYASGALVQCRKKGAKNWGKHKAEEALREDEDYHSEIKMNQLIDNVTHMLDQGQAYDALETMESWDATVDSDPRLRALWDQNMDQLANMFIQELKDGSGDPHALGRVAEMIAHIGIPMPNHKISAILDSKSLLINRLVIRELQYSTLLQVVQSLGAMEHWGLHYYLEDFVDVEDDKAEVIRSLLKLYKSGRGSDVSEIIDRLRREGHEWPEFASFDKSMGAGKITETREAAYKWLKSYLPAWPDYVLRDWLYQSFKGDFGPGDPSPQSVIDKVLGGEGMDAQTRWQFVPDLQFTLDRLTPWTVDKLKARWGGKQNPDMPGIPRDAERHDTQAKLAAQQGGVRDEPVIVKKVGDQYELIEGWHRTVQHFKQFPNGYKGPAWIAINAKPVNENFADGEGKQYLQQSMKQGMAEGAPDFGREWEEAIRYPEFVKLGKEKWIELAGKGKPVTVTRKNVHKIHNTDAADPERFKLLDPEKQKRALAQLANGDVEMPVVARYSDGYLELIGGNTRLTAQMAKDGQAKVWVFNAPTESEQGVAEGKQPGQLVVDAILKVMPTAQEIWFHGSRATGKHRRNSDTDILVVVPDDLVGDQYLGVVRILQKLSSHFDNYDIQPTKAGTNIHRIAQEEGQLLWSNKQGVAENFADGKVKITLYTDPNYYGAEVDDSAGNGKPVTEAELSNAPTGVIFNGNVAYVGQTHGKPIKLSDELKKKIQDLAAKHGAWYEGNGADRAHTKDLIGKWEGSWDDVAAKSIKGYPPQFLYVLFSNVDANNTIKRVGVDPNGTIFDQILKNQNSGKFFPDRSYDADTLREFLGMISQKGSDFNEMAQQPATAENVRRFFKTGERLMWPSNWEDYPNPAGKVAKKANDHRDHWLATRKSGVYVMGAGHLLSVAKIGGFNLIGGESINDLNENFADGKGPGRKGDSARHGIPKGATIAQLEKAAKASGRKGQLARWQLNMRRGRKKAHESEEMTADQWQALRKEDPRSYLGLKDYRNRKWWESHFKAAMAQARVKGESHFEFPPGTNMWYMVTKNPLEEGGSPPHGTPQNELAMMKARTKPAVTFLDMGQYEEMYEPNMEHYDWIKQKWRLPNMDVGYYVIGQPGQEARVKRIGQLIYDMNKNGQTPTADYHRELGRLLGYSEADINGFLKDLEQQN